MQKRIIFAILLASLSLGFSMFAIGIRPVKAAAIIGDVNHDGKVDVRDFYAMGKAYGSHGPPGESLNWDSECDIVVDNVIDIQDFYLMCQHFGEGA